MALIFSTQAFGQKYRSRRQPLISF